jgi:cyclophilin family peptidyl-prolyl cis-trans isomerase
MHPALRLFAVALICTPWGFAYAMAQEDAAAPPAATPAAPASDPASVEFADRMAEWKKMVGNLRELQVRYKVAKPADRPALEEQFQQMVKQGEQMIPQLVEAATTAYKANPVDSGEPARFLISRAESTFRNDDYEECYRISTLLAQHNFNNPVVNEFAGISAFALNDYDSAEKYLKIAAEKNVLSDEGKLYQEEIPKYRKLWSKEQELRTAEAQADDLPRVLLKTNKGDVVIELFENEAPNTVANFISLVEKNFYNNLSFHRVIHGFVAQGGDPKGDGTGGPGYTIACEVNQPNARSHFAGSLSMAHAGPNTGGSQFFITFRPTPHLNGKHTVFGRVIEGMDIVSDLRNTEPRTGDPDKIIEARVLRKREHPYKPATLAGR